eukprot:XP_001709313.1 Hypothetical protein GL50803_35890 [Giardia lamblia ATCC 50803]
MPRLSTTGKSFICISCVFLKYADKLALLIHTRFLQAKLDCGELPRIVGSANEPSGDVRLRADAWAGGAGRKGVYDRLYFDLTCWCVSG